MPRTSSPSLLMSTKYRVQIREKKLFILQFPVFVLGCKIFSLLLSDWKYRRYLLHGTKFLHGIEIILENTSSLKRFSTLKATFEKTVFTVICLEIKSALIVGSSIVKKDV